MFSNRQRKRIRRLSILLIATVVLILGGWTAYKWMQYRKAKFARYPEFGINIPTGYGLHGIDVSKYQHTIAWDEVKAMKVKEVEMTFAFVKATEGIGNTDPQFNRNWKKAKEAGLYRGAYHFFIASKDGRLQAENFVDKVDLEPGDLPPVLDVEQMNGTSAEVLKKEVKEWLDIVEEHYGVKPIIYTNVDFYTRNLGSDFDKYPLWAAHYYQPEEPRISRNWTFWQHSDEGRVNGITSPVDFNVFNGNNYDFLKMLVK